jgi:DNA-directed RNA polymerase subunit RPC12/RpoP
MAICRLDELQICDECYICGELEDKEIEIKCPECGVIYEVLEPEKKPVKCMDCGTEYLQPIHNTANPEYIRAAAYRCRGEK